MLTTDQRMILEALNVHSGLKSTTWIRNRHNKRWGYLDCEEFGQYFMAALEKAGLVMKSLRNGRPLYQISTAGQKALAKPEPVALEIVPPRQVNNFAPWPGSQKWGAESERGDHREIRSVGVAC